MSTIPALPGDNLAMRLLYRLNLRELIELYYYTRFERFVTYLLLMVGVSSACMVGLMLHLGFVREYSGWLVASGFYGLMGLILPGLKGLIRWLRGRPPAVDLEVDQEGVWFVGERGPEGITWDRFTRTYETPRLFVLEFGWSSAFAIPKRCCDNAMLIELLEWTRVKGTLT